MVQLREDDSDTSEKTNVPKHLQYQEPRPLWPYFLLSVAVALIATGVYQMMAKTPPGKCPFHFGSSENPHHTSDEFSEVLEFGSKKKLSDVYRGNVITKEELSKHGIGSEDPWVSVLGHVYDVTKGMVHYGSEGKYNFFTGRDGSRAYSTGHFTEEGLTDDLTGMKPEHIGEIYNWINIFGSKYRHVGRLEGPFFFSSGAPTPSWRELEASLLELGELEERKKALRHEYPSCNSHYDKEAEKAEVWCTIKSGGISRSWAGLPRQLHIPGEKVRCACIEETKLGDPKLKQYPDCDPASASCKLKL